MSDQFDLAPAEWATLRRLLDDALERPAAERDTWVERLDVQFDAFKPRLRALLAHAARGTGALPLDTLPKVETAQFLAERRRAADAPRQGATVGPYHLIRPLGEGGMGEVWLAERSDMLQRRQVALKLPRLLTGRAALAERMAREREILATLAHPNIARLYDAGLTANGRPYLALEYVEGERIDTYCQRKALEVPARLRLVLQVARAVAHAHANLVVHRDLKPANILVTETGEVRLLDFGIAKLLDAGRAQETELTQLAGRALTPDYAAPEQILGQPIGTAADVYALGVVLFELLTGTRPYQLKRDSRAALEEAIVLAQVQRPSSVVTEAKLRKRLRGDLDTIVLKALKRAPAERYGSVEALADDIERHLDQRPVRAQPDSTGYRLRKFVARNRLAVGAGSAVTLALVVGAGVATWQANEARQQQARADMEMQIARKAEKIANAHATLSDMIANDLGKQRSTTDIEAQIERAAELARTQYAGDVMVRAHLLESLAGRYRRIGNVGRSRALSQEAEAAAREAGEVELIAQITCQRARDSAQAGRLADARREVASQITALDQLEPAPLGTLVRCLADASAIDRLTGDARGAIAAAERIRDIDQAAGIEGSINHAGTLMILARAHAMEGRYREAVDSIQKGLAIHARIGSDRSPGANNLRSTLAVMQLDGGQPRAAADILDKLLRDHRSRGGSDEAMATVAYQHALSVLRSGQHDGVLEEVERSLAAARRRDDAGLVRAASLALGQALAASGRHEEARTVMDATASLYASLRSELGYPARLFALARADIELARGDVAAALSALDEAERILRRNAGDLDPTWRQLSALRARAALAGQQPAPALEHASNALRLARQQALESQASLYIGEGLVLVAQAKAALGDTSAAADAKEALRHLEATAASAHPGVEIARGLAGR